MQASYGGIRYDGSIPAQLIELTPQPPRQIWQGHQEKNGACRADEHTIGDGGRKIAEVSRKWFRLRDQYGVAVEPGQNEGLILVVTSVIDMLAHHGR